MNHQDHLNALALELKAAAGKYVAATGLPFQARFNFVDATSFECAERVIVANVEVESTIGALA